YEQTRGRRCVEQQLCEDHVREQLIVGAGQTERAGPDGLRDETEGRDLARTERAGTSEEETIARHRPVNTGAGKDQPIVAAERGNENRDRNDRFASRSEDHLRRGG